MWMVDPTAMCDQHLLGEHVELHMLAGTLARHRSIDGYVVNGLLEPASMQVRHARLVEEMGRRGFNHRSPLPEAELGYLPPAAREARVDADEARRELARRCERCREGLGGE
jgi:hypothetical protein